MFIMKSSRGVYVKKNSKKAKLEKVVILAGWLRLLSEPFFLHFLAISSFGYVL